MKLRLIKAIFILLVIALVAQYAFFVRSRIYANECRKEVDDLRRYIGEVCYLPYRDGALFRLYDAKTNKLVAERTYSDIYPQMLFDGDRVYYHLGVSPEEYVPLPPTLLDRLRAKLP